MSELDMSSIYHGYIRKPSILEAPENPVKIFGEKIRLIGIVGTILSGKDSAMKILIKEYGAQGSSFGDEVRAEATARSILHNPPELQKLGDSLRIEHGVDFWVKRIISKMDLTRLQVIVGQRYEQDINLFVPVFGAYPIIGVDSPYIDRLTRMMVTQRGRQEDKITSEQFKIRNHSDLYGGDGNGGQNTAIAMKRAHYKLWNTGTATEDQLKFENEILRPLLKRLLDR